MRFKKKKRRRRIYLSLVKIFCLTENRFVEMLYVMQLRDLTAGKENL